MRFLQGKGDNYLTELYNDDARLAMMIRLNMISWIEDNFGQESSCPLCTGEVDTTEHVFECPGTINEAGVTVKNLEDGERMKEIVELFRRTEENRRKWLMNEIHVNFDGLRREGTL